MIPLRIEFIQKHRKEWPISMMCRVLHVSRSYYYKYLKQGGRIRPPGEQALEQRLAALFYGHRGL